MGGGFENSDIKTPGTALVSPIPSSLLASAAAAGDERICLVIGAGCSYDTPTRLPLSKDLAREAFEQLVADRVINPEDCGDPGNLALLADAVYVATGGQGELIRRMRPARFRTAQPNVGYRFAAALMLEGVVRTIVTLNYDLAMTTALAEVGAGDRVACIKCPEEWDRGMGRLVVYLHGNIEGDWEKLVFRTCQLTDDWKDRWEQVAAQASLAAPTLVFAGLGSPAPILTISEPVNELPRSG